MTDREPTPKPVYPNPAKPSEVDKAPTGPKIDERRWVGEDSWADEHMSFRGWYVAIGLGCLTWVAVFVLGIIAGHLFL